MSINTTTKNCLLFYSFSLTYLEQHNLLYSCPHAHYSPSSVKLTFLIINSDWWVEFPFDNKAPAREESCEEMQLMSYGDRTQCSSSLPHQMRLQIALPTVLYTVCQVRNCLDLILSQLSAPSGNLWAILIATVPQKEKRTDSQYLTAWPQVIVL